MTEFDPEAEYRKQCEALGVEPHPEGVAKFRGMEVVQVEPVDEMRHKIALLRTHIAIIEHLIETASESAN